MQDQKTQASRRGFFLAAGVTGAAVAAGSLLPGQPAGMAAPPVEALPPAPEKGGGYVLSEHVKRYYRTTQV